MAVREWGRWDGVISGFLHIGVGWERGMASNGGYTQRIGMYHQ